MSLNQICFAVHPVGMGSEVVMSRLIEVTNLPLFRAVEIGPMNCPCNGKIVISISQTLGFGQPTWEWTFCLFFINHSMCFIYLQKHDKDVFHYHM